MNDLNAIIWTLFCSLIYKLYAIFVPSRHIKWKNGKHELMRVFESEYVPIHEEKFREQNAVIQSFFKFNWIKPQEAYIIAEHFYTTTIEMVKKTYRVINDTDVILICNVKDEIERIPIFLEHYRKLGIKYYAFIDNKSTDGTFEYLLEQDVDLFSVSETYNSIRRAGWVMKIANYYGYNRWYVIVDSDELLTYVNCEEKIIETVIDDCRSKKIDRCLAFMMDMYPKKNTMDGKRINILEEYRYFDTDSYTKKIGTLGYQIYGGPRKRYFHASGKGELLTKYPIVFWKAGDIYRYHFIFPTFSNFSQYKMIVLRHYKFLNTDIKKIETAISEQNYSNGSKFYKDYYSLISENNEWSFMYSGSKEYTDSNDINRIII